MIVISHNVLAHVENLKDIFTIFKCVKIRCLFLKLGFCKHDEKHI